MFLVKFNLYFSIIDQDKKEKEYRKKRILINEVAGSNRIDEHSNYTGVTSVITSNL